MYMLQFMPSQPTVLSMYSDTFSVWPSFAERARGFFSQLCANSYLLLIEITGEGSGALLNLSSSRDILLCYLAASCQ